MLCTLIACLSNESLYLNGINYSLYQGVFIGCGSSPRAVAHSSYVSGSALSISPRYFINLQLISLWKLNLQVCALEVLLVSTMSIPDKSD